MADASKSALYSGRTLVIICHPHLHTGSRVHHHLHSAVTAHTVNHHITVHTLYDKYMMPDGQILPIDAAYEQHLLLSHDRIILQYPMYWYTFPSLLKEWLDVVLTRHFAYGTGGAKLHGKQLGIAVSIGSADPVFYTGGHADKLLQHAAQHTVSLDAMLTPITATSTLIGTEWLPPFVVQGSYYLSDKQLERVECDYTLYLTAAEPSSTKIAGQVDADRAHMAS